MSDISRGRGRPRSDVSRAAILEAALALSKEIGFPNMTVEELSRRAHVGKQTIYRWWPSLEDVMFEALAEAAVVEIRRESVSSSKAVDLSAFIGTTFKIAKKIKPVLVELMALSQLNPSLRKRFYDQFIKERREVLAIVLRRRFPEAPAARIALYVDMIFGLMWYRLLLEHLPITEQDVKQMVQMLEQHEK